MRAHKERRNAIRDRIHRNGPGTPLDEARLRFDRGGGGCGRAGGELAHRSGLSTVLFVLRPMRKHRMASPTIDVREDVATLYRDGIVGKKGAFAREWVEQLREDMMTAFWEAIQRPGRSRRAGAEALVYRNPPAGDRRVCRPRHASLGDGDVRERSRAGVQDRRDRFRHALPRREDPAVAPRLPFADGDYQDRRITSLAFNLTGVDVTRRHGTIRDRAGHAMGRRTGVESRDVPGPVRCGRALTSGECGSIRGWATSRCRSALTMHRGTPHPSPVARPVLVLGVDAPGAGHAALHDMMVTQRLLRGAAGIRAASIWCAGSWTSCSRSRRSTTSKDS